MRVFLLFLCICCLGAWAYLMIFPETLGIKVSHVDPDQDSPYKYFPRNPLEVIKDGRTILLVTKNGEVYLEGDLVGYSECLRDVLKGEHKVITRDY